MSEDARDDFWMRRALAEAARGEGSVEPNPMVGAVVVRDGRLVSVGHHARFGGRHAEIAALTEAGPAAEGATLYVTLEPCCHVGKTPPCADAIVRAGVRRVVAALLDPFPQVAGGGFAVLEKAGLTVTRGVLEADARRLLGPYLKRTTTGLPFVIAKWAMTVDGKTACASGESRWVSGPRSRAIVHELRGKMDAIVVGIGTALADDPELTARPSGPRTPARVVLDSEARLPVDGKLARTARDVPVLVAVTSRAPAERVVRLREAGCEVVPFDDPVPVRPLLHFLGERGATNVLVEGGGQVLGSFHDADQIDAVEVFVAPLLEGGPAKFTPVQGRGVARMCDALGLIEARWQQLDADLHLSARVARPWLGRG